MPASVIHVITLDSACAQTASLSTPSNTMGAPAVERAQYTSCRGGWAWAMAARHIPAVTQRMMLPARFMVRTSSGAGNRVGPGARARGAPQHPARRGVARGEPLGAGGRALHPPLGRCKRLHPRHGPVNGFVAPMRPGRTDGGPAAWERPARRMTGGAAGRRHRSHAPPEHLGDGPDLAHEGRELMGVQ